MCSPTTVLSLHGCQFTALTLIGWSASTPGGRTVRTSGVERDVSRTHRPGERDQLPRQPSRARNRVRPRENRAGAIPTGWEREKEPAMALSNDEQRTLDEIERSLRDEDPVFVQAVDFDRLRLRRVMTGALVFLTGKSK